MICIFCVMLFDLGPPGRKLRHIVGLAALYSLVRSVDYHIYKYISACVRACVYVCVCTWRYLHQNYDMHTTIYLYIYIYIYMSIHLSIHPSTGRLRTRAAVRQPDLQPVGQRFRRVPRLAQLRHRLLDPVREVVLDSDEPDRLRLCSPGCRRRHAGHQLPRMRRPPAPHDANTDQHPARRNGRLRRPDEPASDAVFHRVLHPRTQQRLGALRLVSAVLSLHWLPADGLPYGFRLADGRAGGPALRLRVPFVGRQATLHGRQHAARHRTRLRGGVRRSDTADDRDEGRTSDGAVAGETCRVDLAGGGGGACESK